MTSAIRDRSAADTVLPPPLPAPEAEPSCCPPSEEEVSLETEPACADAAVEEEGEEEPEAEEADARKPGPRDCRRDPCTPPSIPLPLEYREGNGISPVPPSPSVLPPDVPKPPAAIQ